MAAAAYQQTQRQWENKLRAKSGVFSRPATTFSTSPSPMPFSTSPSSMLVGSGGYGQSSAAAAYQQTQSQWENKLRAKSGVYSQPIKSQPVVAQASNYSSYPGYTTPQPTAVSPLASYPTYTTPQPTAVSTLASYPSYTTPQPTIAALPMTSMVAPSYTGSTVAPSYTGSTVAPQYLPPDHEAYEKYVELAASRDASQPAMPMAPTSNTIGSTIGSVVAPPYTGSTVAPQYLPPDHEAYEAYLELAASRDGSLAVPPMQEQEEYQPTQEEGHHTSMVPLGLVGHRVGDTIHRIEDNLAEDVHAIHDKVSDFFGNIFNLFHSNKNAPGHKGPAGTELGEGSTVEVTRPDGVIERGHLMEETPDLCFVQLHTNPPGEWTQFPTESVRHLTEFAPVIGAGVEVLFNGVWCPGLVVGLPHKNQDPPMYAVYCHGDAPDQRTLADEHAIRPLLSQAEKAVVKEHMDLLRVQKEAEAAVARVEAERLLRLQAEAAAVQAAADAEKRRADAAKAKEEAELLKKADFKRKLIENGLGSFIDTFVENGYDTEDSLELMIESELTEFGLKSAHKAKFYIAFPRGERYVVSNANLCSSAPGVPYRTRSPSGSISDESFRLAHFGSIVIGTELISGFLMVGNMYLPMAVDGKQVMYREGSEPKKSGSTKPGSMLGKVEERVEDVAGKVREEVGHVASVVGAVASKVDSKLHEFAHMLHFF